MKTRICNVSVELPTLTMAVNERFEEFDELEQEFKNGDVKARAYYEGMYDLLSFLTSEEDTCKILQGDSIEDIDLNNLSIALIDVREAYLKPVEQHRIEGFNTMYGQVSKATEGLTGLITPLQGLVK